MNPLSQIIKSAEQENIVDMTAAVNDMMRSKVAAVLDDMRQEVAQRMFEPNHAEVNEEDLNEGGITRGAVAGAIAGGATMAAVGHSVDRSVGGSGVGGAVLGGAVGAVSGAVKGALVGAAAKGIHRAGVEHKEKKAAKKAAMAGGK